MISNRGKVLIIEDSPEHRELIRRAFERYNESIELVLVDSAEKGLRECESSPPDLIFVDYFLAGMDGIEFIRELFHRNIQTPVILMTGRSDEATAMEAIKSGAFDYVVKDIGYHNALPYIYRMALVRYRYEDETNKLTRSLLSINKAVTDMSSSLDMERVLDIFLTNAMDLVGAEAGAVFEKQDGSVKCRICHNMPPDLVCNNTVFENTGSSRTIGGDELPPELRNAGVQCMLAVPVDLSEDRKTCMALISFSAEEFPERKIQEIDLLASAVKSAIKNSMLFEMVSRSQKLWTETFDAIKDFVFITDEKNIIIKTNSAFADFVRLHPRDIVGKPYHDLLRIDNYSDLPSGREEFTREITMNGETYLMSGFPITLEDGTEAMINVMKNITEIQKLKTQLYHTDKLSSLGLLVSGVAHEINNPLTGILGYTELLQMKTKDESLSKELSKIYASAERCKTIVENLLTFSRQKPPERSLENINDIIDKTVELRAYWLRSNNVEIEKNYSDIPYSLLDAQQIQQVILNMIINAEHAISQVARERKGRIRISTEYSAEDNTCQIEIMDNGTGIEKNIINRIFDPFFTTKPVDKGTGLGLSISHGIIKEHGGEIEVESSAGEYTLFRIRLPIITEKP